jgi:hypothetical protein
VSPTAFTNIQLKNKNNKLNLKCDLPRPNLFFSVQLEITGIIMIKDKLQI